MLIHAICNACLGAAGLGDIGRHFPDGDEQYKNIASRELLRKVHAMIAARGWSLVNLDSTIVAQAPRLAPYVQKMAAHTIKFTQFISTHSIAAPGIPAPATHRDVQVSREAGCRERLALVLPCTS